MICIRCGLTVRGGEAAAEFDGAAVHSPPTCISRMAERIAALEELLVTTRARWAEAQGKLGRVEDFLCKTTGERQGIEENLRALVAENAALREDKARLVQALEKAVDVYGKPGGPWNVPGEPGTWLAQARTALDAARKEAPGDEAQGD